MIKKRLPQNIYHQATLAGNIYTEIVMNSLSSNYGKILKQHEKHMKKLPNLYKTTF